MLCQVLIASRAFEQGFDDISSSVCTSPSSCIPASDKFSLALCVTGLLARRPQRPPPLQGPSLAASVLAPTGWPGDRLHPSWHAATRKFSCTFKALGGSSDGLALLQTARSPLQLKLRGLSVIAHARSVSKRWQQRASGLVGCSRWRWQLTMIQPWQNRCRAIVACIFVLH